jgi:alpha-L-arabinofuranosidase
MDKYDPEKRVGLIVDEWGSWHEVEPGTNPGFLYQQNTMRDAIVAALTFNIFHSHADRVQMTNIAQMINVLQAMILTEGAKMVLTPTYHVFEMFKVHQDSMLLPAHTSFGTYEMENEKITQVSGSASRSADGKINVSLCNLHHESDTVVECEIRGAKVSGISGRILAADSICSHNTFEKPNDVKPMSFDGFKSSKGKISVELPARSVVVMEIE